MTTNNERRSLTDRLSEGPVLCAEGYLFELERRGYLQAGAFVPEVVLEHPAAVAQLHREVLRAGSDVLEAFTYYAHREKLRLIGKEDQLESLQRNALDIANSVADEADFRPLVAGNICNTNVYSPGDANAEAEVRKMFDEQIAWAAEANVDFIIAETIRYHGEAELALRSIKAANLPAAVMLVVDADEQTRDGLPIAEACQRLEQAGADVVGMNCSRGPQTMLPLIARIRDAVSCHVGGLPVPYRTTAESPTFQSLSDPDCSCIPDDRPFPTALDPFVCNRYEMGEYAQQADEMGVRFLGACCGAAPHHIRSMAEALGRQPEASRYSPDMTKHWAFGKNERLKSANLDYAEKLRHKKP